MRPAVAWALVLALAVAQAQPDAPPAGAATDNPFDYPETIIRAEDEEGMVRPANFVEPGMPVRLIVRFHRGVKMDDAVQRLMVAPASQLVSAASVPDPAIPAASTIGGLPGAREVRRLRGVVRGVLVELPGGIDRADAIAALKAMPDVKDVEAEGRVTVQIAKVASIGGDVEVQPGLLRTGLARPSDGGGLLVEPNADAEARSVVVAVVDTGVDRTHPDLNVVGGVDFTNDNDYGLDGNGHGTHVAGIIGAKNDGIGSVGAVPGAPIWSLKVLSAAGQGTTTDVVEALNWVADNGRDKGVRVVNLSLSGPRSRMMCDAVRAVVARGITVVAAAGNNGLEIGSGSPSDCIHALVVTAIADYDGKPGGLRQPPPGPGAPTTRDDAPAGFSNYAAARSTRVVAAPGVHILSTVPPARCAALRCTRAGSYAYLSGTSMAAPLVSGMAALCYNTGSCDSPRATAAPTLYDAFYAANREDRGYGFVGDPANPLPGKHYGYLAASAF
ncbi:serine protease [Raphidocelis subcapitata]|uniref:Serine protease n=1 Tax=Raphidocelis subcapitata TaxID=307507 RepID=A0A2V0PGH0_9CHLO|nr:serine protease [Raphidocelis subcapitata]|eukprot:GBF98921.1 serine protease [Raphidocelis subcapitata]